MEVNVKFVHLSDLHLGKRVNDFSMLEDQEYILAGILNGIDEIKPQAVILAGDIYDKPVPSAEAVELFDDFLVSLKTRNLKVFVISGNHDSPERISFGGRIMNASGIFMAPVFNGKLEPIPIEDEFGAVNIYMLPFVKPANVKRFYPEEEIKTYTEAIEIVIKNLEVSDEKRNILVTHQFVTGAITSDSEEISVGGSENVNVNIFDDFDYVALGHIHGPQQMGRPTVRYCGTPLKYSFSEVNHKKSMTVVEMKEKGSIEIHIIPLIPKRDLKEIKGSYMEITAKSYYDNIDKEAYMHITLTDEEDIPHVIGKLRTIYPYIMKVDYDNKRTRSNAEISNIEMIEEKTPMENFAKFYELQNNQSFSKEQSQFVENLIEKIWEGEE